MKITPQIIVSGIITLLLLGAIFMPLQTNAAGLVPCGGFEIDENGNRIVELLDGNPVPEGWQKINDTERAKKEPACGFCHIFQLGHNIVTFFLLPSESINNNIPVVPLMATLLFAVGGVYLLSGAGSPELHEKGKKTLTSVVIGLLIVYAAWVFVNTFLMFLGVAEWTRLGSWWQIQCGG